MKKTIAISIIVLPVLVYIGCNKLDISPQLETYSMEPILSQTVADYDLSHNDDLATLGRVLFYDKKLSLNNSVSCGSCHQQSRAFCDNKQFSIGLQDIATRRNTPTIVLHGGDLFWDGRANNFHDLALMPLVNHIEMKNYDILKLENKLKAISYYPDLFAKAYGTNEITIDKIQSGIAEFLANFNFTKNKYEATLMGQASLTSEEQLGRDLFFNKAKCSNCHGGQGFSGWKGGNECIGLDENYADNGFGELTQKTEDNGKFRIPSLLNIAFTAPYMHDGRFKTLEEVIEHYNSGVKQHPNLSWSLTDFTSFENMSDAQILLKLDKNNDGDISENEIPRFGPAKLNLTEQEKRSLIAFLNTLSDPSLFTDLRFSDPFVIKK